MLGATLPLPITPEEQQPQQQKTPLGTGDTTTIARQDSIMYPAVIMILRSVGGLMRTISSQQVVI